MRRVLHALGGLLLALPFTAAASELTGRVSLGVEGARLGALGPTVVFLESEAGGPGSPKPSERRTVRQRNARFDPEFLVIAVGQDVEMPNDDTIFHNVFSFSRPNDFDLGVYPAGDSRTVRFAHAGLVKLYCSIHESMSGAILVAPSPWFANVSGSGDYRIRGVPPGRYRLTVWNEKLPVETRAVELGPGPAARVDLRLGSATP